LCEVNYIDGLIQWIFKSYHENGQLFEEVNYSSCLLKSEYIKHINFFLYLSQKKILKKVYVKLKNNIKNIMY
jgi:antitoxin component YwqK of YwqJK toxin-antitoxin module